MTYSQLQRWMPSASLHSTPLLGLFYFCCFGFARPLCVCCFAVVRPWTVSMALHGRASSLWDNLPCLFDHTCLRRLHLLKVFTRKASWVSVSPGAHLPVRMWKDYAFIFFWYMLKIVRVHAYFWDPERGLHVITKKWYRFRKNGLLLWPRHLLALDKSF